MAGDATEIMTPLVEKLCIMPVEECRSTAEEKVSFIKVTNLSNMLEIILGVVVVLLFVGTKMILSSLQEIERKLGMLIDLAERSIPPKH